MTLQPMFPPGSAVDPADIPYDEDGLKHESSAPCQLHCPSGIDIPSYMALIAQGRFDEAVEVIRQDNPFPWVCGLICPHPCELWCQRRHLDSPLRIKDLKAVAAKHAIEKASGYPVLKPKKTFDDKVAVVGAGPAGLSAAYFLALEGYRVTIFEAFPQAGGMLVTGIPEYRLPREIVRKEIEAIQAMGVEIRVNTPVGVDLSLDDLRKDGFKAFFIGVGAWKCMDLRIEGENDFPQVVGALPFLTRVSFGDRKKPADSVAIIGGGNSAVDAARTCVRLGCESVVLAYRRTRAEMPAHEAEIREMLEEGVILQELTVPTKVIGSSGRVEYLECLKAELGPPDKSGRRRPVPIPGSENRIPVGAIIRAIGQRPHLNPYPGLSGLDITKWETIDTDPVTQQSSMPDVFAGGDVATGPATVVEAIGGGKRAAAAIHAYLRDQPMPKAEPIRPRRMVEPTSISYEEKSSIKRHSIPTIDIERRKTTFDQVEVGLDEHLAKEEAKRCLRCDICERCWKCQEVCAEKLGVSAIQFLEKEEKSLVIADHAAWIQRCIACGSCVNICPTGALQLRQQNGELALLMNGAVVNKVQMEQCEGCGIYFVPSRLVDHVAERLEFDDMSKGKKLCQECKRIERAAAMVGEVPDFSTVTLDKVSFPGI